jgi:hypothetical protein
VPLEGSTSRLRIGIRFPKREIDFGQILQGETIRRSFPFTNAGRAPLVLKKIDTLASARSGRSRTRPSRP